MPSENNGLKELQRRGKHLRRKLRLILQEIVEWQHAVDVLALRLEVDPGDIAPGIWIDPSFCRPDPVTAAIAVFGNDIISITERPTGAGDGPDD